MRKSFIAAIVIGVLAVLSGGASAGAVNAPAYLNLYTEPNGVGNVLPIQVDPSKSCIRIADLWWTESADNNSANYNALLFTNRACMGDPAARVPKRTYEPINFPQAIPVLSVKFTP